MTTIVQVLDRCARECSVDPQTDWTAATDEGAVALRDDFLLETVDEIQDRVDLPDPFSGKKSLTSTDDKVGSYFSMPADFKRLHLDINAVYDTGQDRPCVPVTSDGDWTHLQEWGATGAERYYRLNGYDEAFGIQFDADLAAGDTIEVHYVSKNWMVTSGGTEGSAFTAVTDILLYPRKLIEAGIVKRFRERNGLDYMSKLGEFERELHRLANTSKSRRVVRFGDREKWSPFDVPVPNYIPEA